MESPGYEWDIIQEYIGQWWILLNIRHPLVDDHHDKGSDQEHSEYIYKTKDSFPDLRV